ncbi:MAG: ferritin-like domain-containing protein [Methanomassiliicoccales archaeon]|jgi:bacterioferritin
MASQKLKDLMNKGLASEIQATIQYMWQHVQWIGVEHYAVSDEFKNIAIQEMKHAEKIAERLWYLEGVPTTKPAPIQVGGEMWEMVDNDIIAEQQAIDLYKEIMEVAAKEGDVTTRFIFEQILEQEEEHHDFFTSLKQGQPKKTSKAK